MWTEFPDTLPVSLGEAELEPTKLTSGQRAQPSVRAVKNCERCSTAGSPVTAKVPTVAPPSFTTTEVHTADQLRQWVLHYQPKLNLKTGALAGIEALVRWDHPEHGLVYPDRFIAVAENCGAIDSLTEWVMQEALMQQTRWRGVGPELVAEEVETEEDWHLLREIGCDLAQGHFIGRPMTSERIPVWGGQWQLRRASLVGS